MRSEGGGLPRLSQVINNNNNNIIIIRRIDSIDEGGRKACDKGACQTNDVIIGSAAPGIAPELTKILEKKQGNPEIYSFHVFQIQNTFIKALKHKIRFSEILFEIQNTYFGSTFFLCEIRT